MGYDQDVKAYAESIKNEFTHYNEYNSKVVSFGYVAFFALATYVKDLAPKKFFVTAVLLMSASIAIFVVLELCRSMYFSRYSTLKAKALEKLPERNLLQQIDDAHMVACIRFQKTNLLFFWPSCLLGIAGLVILFLCYLNILIYR